MQKVVILRMERKIGVAEREREFDNKTGNISKK